MNKLNISIGIPAFNEQGNIAKLLISILDQSGDNFVIKEIIVVSDGSTDQTEFHVRLINDPRIRLIINPQRIGQSSSQNIIFSQAKCDTIVLFEADTKIKGNNYLEEMAKMFLSDKSIALIQGNLITLPGITLVGKVLSRQMEVYHNYFLRRTHLFRQISSGRGGRLFNKKLLINFSWPLNVPEDVYALLWCRKEGKNAAFCLNAKCLFKSSQNVKDFLRQRKKISAGSKTIEKYFSKSEIRKIYQQSILDKFRMFMIFAIFYPFSCAGYIILKLRSTWAFTSSPFTDNWEISDSTKILEVKNL